MTCHEMGELQAYLDGEMSRTEKKEIMRHLEGCEACRANLNELQSLNAFCEEKLEVEELEVDIDQAWTTFEKSLQQENKVNKKTSKGWSTMKTKTKRWIVSGVAAASILSTLAVPQVQVAANQFLSLFRVDEFEVVKLTQNDLREIENWVQANEAGTFDLKGIGKIKMSETTGEEKYFESIQEANEQGYSIPDLAQFEAKGVQVSPASKMTFTINVEKANQLLSQLGSESEFEAVLDKEPFTVSTYEAIRTEYVRNNEHFSYMQTTSPEVKVPAGASIGQLRNTLLSLPFLPENVKQQLASIDNIENTLPIPYFEEEGATINEVSVKGNQGLLVENNHHSSVVWQENGNIHMVSSEHTISADELMEVAKELLQ